MSLDIETLGTLSSADRMNTIAKHLKSMPLTQRASVIETIQRGLRKREAARLTYNWSLHARDSQLPPEGDWDTWLILAGRGFGKTRTGAEWVRAQSMPRTPIRGRKQTGNPHCPRRPRHGRSPVRHDRGRVWHFEHLPTLEHARLRAIQDLS